MAENLTPKSDISPQDILNKADALQRKMDISFRDSIIQSTYADAEKLAKDAVRQKGDALQTWGDRFDRIITNPFTGLPLMGFGLAAVIWLTIAGANYPSQWIFSFLFWLGDLAKNLFIQMGSPWWLTGFLWDGVYRGLAWVISVMLPPMAIFFPMFTILEDLGFLPRISFNMDWLFKIAGAHGKQALTMTMGFGCNAAGVTACRIIDSPRERLIAILTNNFVPCNGRFPTLIMLATIFLAAGFKGIFASMVAAGAVVMVVLIGVFFTLAVSALLSRTVLKGEPSSFSLELPPYRKPDILRILYTSTVERTIFVLWRAITMAAPCGGIIWLFSNIHIYEKSLSLWVSQALQPLGHAIGLDGVILLAYIIAIPANEIVVPTILMVYSNADKMVELASMEQLKTLLIDQQGWTLLTAINLMLFSLLHNPCSTAIWTIYSETKSLKWTVIGTLMPLSIAFLVTFIIAQGMRALGWF